MTDHAFTICELAQMIIGGLIMASLMWNFLKLGLAIEAVTTLPTIERLQYVKEQ